MEDYGKKRKERDEIDQQRKWFKGKEKRDLKKKEWETNREIEKKKDWWQNLRLEK